MRWTVAATLGKWMYQTASTPEVVPREFQEAGSTRVPLETLVTSIPPGCGFLPQVSPGPQVSGNLPCPGSGCCRSARLHEP